MNPLQLLYSFGLKLDRSFTQSLKLPYPVISVGNISVGGRAKTPLVIDLCISLKSMGYAPVVLTRGYARKSKKDIWLLPETIDQLHKLSVQESGDEAVEIYLKARVPVLVSADRSQQAFNYAHQFKNSKTLFLLDDGFQHWKIQRDLDLVVVSEADFKDSLLPTGRLRESVEALSRADCVLNLEKDLIKKIEVPHCETLSSVSSIAVTTRAGSQKTYEKMLSEYLNFPVSVVALKDHLNKEALSLEIQKLNSSVKQLILGYKEAVKLLTPQQLIETQRGPYVLSFDGRSFDVFIVDLKLEYKKEKIFELLKDKGLLS